MSDESHSTATPHLHGMESSPKLDEIRHTCERIEIMLVDVLTALHLLIDVLDLDRVKAKDESQAS